MFAGEDGPYRAAGGATPWAAGRQVWGPPFPERRHWCGRNTSQRLDHDMVIQDTPVLERLLVVDQEGPTRINVISMPKLTVVGYSSDKYSELVIGSTPVQVQQPPSTSPSTN